MTPPAADHSVALSRFPNGGGGRATRGYIFTRIRFALKPSPRPLPRHPHRRTKTHPFPEIARLMAFDRSPGRIYRPVLSLFPYLRRFVLNCTAPVNHTRDRPMSPQTPPPLTTPPQIVCSVTRPQLSDRHGKISRKSIIRPIDEVVYSTPCYIYMYIYIDYRVVE